MIYDVHLNEFVNQIINLSVLGFPIEPVTILLKRFNFDVIDFSPYIYYDSTHYTRNLVYHCPEFEVLLLCWSPGQLSPIHGHEGEKCWMRVLKGSLYFINYHEMATNSADLELISERHGDAGFVDGPAVIHKVENRTNDFAVSLHLYAKPFLQCDVYSIDEHSKAKMQIQYDTIYGKQLDKRINQQQLVIIVQQLFGK